MTAKQTQNKAKTVGFFTLSMIVIGSMIGAGLLVVPNQMMSYKFGGTLGWIIASICSLVLARIFSDMSLSANGQGGLQLIIGREYGRQSGFIAGFTQWIFILIGSCAILFGLMDYLSEFYGLTSTNIQFAIASLIITSTTCLHAITSGAMKLMSIVTVLKILLFGLCALLGITEFNPTKVFGLPLSGGLIQFGSALIQQNGGIFHLCLGSFQAASVAMFAFAGIENAASTANVRDPKKNIPRAIMFGLVVCSFVYFFTHICVVNASEVYSATPVKLALTTLSSYRFGPWIGQLLGSFVSIVAMLGCFGTLLALGSVMPNILSSSLKIANPSFNTPVSRTGVPFVMTILSLVPMLSIICLNYMTSIDLRDLMTSTYSFLLVYFYLQCVLAHYNAFRKKRIGILGLAAIAILLLGFVRNPIPVFYGILLIELFAKSVFAILNTNGSSTSMHSEKSDIDKTITP